MLVACAVTENVLPPASAMLHSLTEAVGDASVDVIVLHDGPLSTAGRSRVEQTVAAGGGRVEFVSVPGNRLADFPSGRFPRVIWARVLLPELFPDRRKVLYLDIDTIVLDSPATLWKTELGDNYLAAVANPLYGFMEDRASALGIRNPRGYINSGVLLMNLDLMRADDAARRLLEYARAHPANPYPDQDALSAVFSERLMALHPRWNAQTTLWDLPERVQPFDAREVREARADPAIVHFIGPFKPWHRLCTHPFRQRYFEHAAATPWPLPEPEGDTAVNSVLRHLPPVWINRWFRLRQTLARR